MSERSGPGAGAAIGLLVAVAIVGLLGFAAYTAIEADLPGKWVYTAVAAGLVLAQLAGFGLGVRLVTRGVASVAYLLIAVAVTLLIVGVDRDGMEIVFGLRLETAVPWMLTLLVTAGAVAMPAMPSSNPGRAAGAVVALAAVAPWWVGAMTGAPPEAILSGAGRFYESWPALAQPALIGGVLALAVLLLVGVAILGGRGRADQRVLAACALAIPGVAGALMLAYAFGGSAGPAAPTPDVATDAGAGEPPPVVRRRAAADAGAPAPATGYDCSGVIFPDRDVASIRDGFTPGRWRQSAIELLEVRYPDAAWMVGTLEDPNNFDAWFQGQTGDWGSMIMALDTGVHESAHMAGLQGRRGRRHRYVVGKGDVVEIRVPETFDRSEIADRLPDEIRSMSYTETYLSGKSGAQGFEMVLEELNAYTYSLYVAIATMDQKPKTISTSARDGLLTLMYYTEAYLRLAREERTKTYEAIAGDEDLVAAVLKLYDRAACVMKLSGSDRRIGLKDEMLAEHVFGAKRLGEIDRLR